MNSKLLQFFSTKSVNNKLMKGTLSERQIFFYFYLILMFDTITFVQSWLSIAGKTPTLIDLVNIWGSLIINAIGLIFLYIVNGGARGQNFLSKYFSFSVTVGYKYVLAFYIVGIVLMLIPSFTSPSYQIAAFVIINILMVANIAYRIYGTRTLVA